MAVTIPRPDPSSPDDVAAATFNVVRRGYEPAEVKELLRMVAAELARLQDRERVLERDLRAAQRPTVTTAVALDEEVVTRMLGEEAARILSTAREAAAQIRGRAEENAAQLLREASDEAQRLREEVSVESSRRRADASADAEAELEMAKQQGREMVEEARAYREKVLNELSRRRDLARQQVDQLLHGRDRLLQAFERARLAAVDVLADMAPLQEPEAYVNLDPITGPVPALVAADRLRPPVSIVTEHPDDEGETPDPQASEVDGDDDVETVDGVDEAPPANVVALFAGERSEPATSPPEPPAADDVFARLRAARADRVAEAVNTATVDTETVDTESDDTANDDTASDDTVATVTSVFARTPDAPPEVVDEPDDTPFARRDAALTPIIVAAARKLKRVLADEQNDSLAILRKADAVGELADLVPSEHEQIDRYVAAVREELFAAATAGAASVEADEPASTSIRSVATIQPAVDALAAGIVVPLRDRVERAVFDAAGDNSGLGDRVRALYREWKNQRIDEQLEHVVHVAFGRGALAGLTPGTAVCWRVDPNGPDCPDAEDNALAGEVAAGDEFPTGNTCAPAHEGCRCMLEPAQR